MMKHQMFYIAELRQPDCHFYVAFRRLSAIGAEQSVPPWQIEAVIAVGLADDHGVMHPMHVRGDYEISQYVIKIERNSNITMIEHGHVNRQDRKR